MIVGVGTDIVQIERIRKLRPPAIARLLTNAESAYCNGHADAAERIAGRFAAKEAILKALGTGLSGGASWKNIEILPGPRGEPTASFSGATRRRMRAAGATHCHLSISHQGGFALAFAVLEARKIVS